MNKEKILSAYHSLPEKHFSFDYFYLLALREGAIYMGELHVYMLCNTLGYTQGNISFRPPSFPYRAYNIMAVSGGFDPPHKGHYSMFKNAYEYSEKTFDHEKNIFIHRPTKVVAILNSDDWLKRKKGYSFMSFDERKFILESCKYIDHVIGVDDTDGTVCSALLDIQPDIFANGGDRKEGNTPEVDICSQLNIKVIWGIGGDKIQSSSDLVSNVKK